MIQKYSLPPKNHQQLLTPKQTQNTIVFNQDIDYLNSFQPLQSPSSPECFICYQRDVQVQCYNCPKTFHFRCLRPRKTVFKQQWICQFCKDRKQSLCGGCGLQIKIMRENNDYQTSSIQCSKDKSQNKLNNGNTDKMYKECKKIVANNSFPLMIETTQNKQFFICTLCSLIYHQQCANVPQKILDPLQYCYLPQKNNFVCPNCSLNRGFIQNIDTKVENQTIFFFLRIRDRSPIHRCWISQDVLKEMTIRQLQHPKLYQEQQLFAPFEVKKIQRILDIKIPVAYKLYDSKTIVEILQQLRDSQISYGDYNNFKFLVKWQQSSYLKLSWEDQSIVTKFQIPYSNFLRSLKPSSEPTLNLWKYAQNKKQKKEEQQCEILSAISKNIYKNLQSNSLSILISSCNLLNIHALLHYLHVDKMSKNQAVMIVTEFHEQWKDILGKQLPKINVISLKQVSEQEFSIIAQKQLRVNDQMNVDMVLLDYSSFANFGERIGKYIPILQIREAINGNSHKVGNKSIKVLVLDQLCCQYYRKVQKYMQYSKVIITSIAKGLQRIKMMKMLTDFSQKQHKSVVIYKMDQIFKEIRLKSQHQHKVITTETKNLGNQTTGKPIMNEYVIINQQIEDIDKIIQIQPMELTPSQTNGAHIISESIRDQSPILVNGFDMTQNMMSIPEFQTSHSPSGIFTDTKLTEINRILIHQYLLTYGCNKISSVQNLTKQLQNFARLKKITFNVQSSEKLWMHFQLYLSYLKEASKSNFQDLQKQTIRFLFFDFHPMVVFKQICNMSKLYIFYQQYNNSPLLFKLETHNKEMQQNSGYQTHLCPISRFILICLVLVKGFGQWQRILNSHQWVHYLGTYRQYINKNLWNRPFKEYIVKFYVKPNHWMQKNELIQRLEQELIILLNSKAYTEIM